ncbi:MAG: HU family DNA-binding protein [Gordonia sp. (in: high G+C Gram-positive bacteria)]|uniref:HU family DNA-binding protein n=1 Tax=Gordonia sp. (in: high G+C Gram-positive bacteria) TaxID=84139 RepID=UPI0039E3F931
MNKAQLIEELTKRLGADRKTATDAVETIVDTIVRAVSKGESVTITGFGVFEKRRRAPRVARNPRTGETVRVDETSVPAFRPGAQFKEIIAGRRELKAGEPAVKRASSRSSAPVEETAASAGEVEAPAATETIAAEQPAAESSAVEQSATESSAVESSAAELSAPEKSTVKKTTGDKKAATKKTGSTKTGAGKSGAGKSGAGKSGAGKTAARKAAAKKNGSTKTEARKTEARKAAARKTAAASEKATEAAAATDSE